MVVSVQHDKKHFYLSSIIGILILLTTSCSAIRKIDTMTHTGPTLTSQQAKDEVYAIAQEIITAIHPVADIDGVYFSYESGYDGSNLVQSRPPFRAVIGIPVTTHPKYAKERFTDTYRDILLKLPGYSTKGNKHSHSPIIYKNDTFIYLPTHTSEAFEINGPLYVYEDLRKIRAQWDWNSGAHGPLHVENVTSDFLPPKTHHQQSTLPSTPTRPTIGRRNTP